VLLPVYAAIAAAIVFYLLVPIAGAFLLRSQWRSFRARVSILASVPRLRYRDLAAARREGRARVGSFRLHGSIEAIEGSDKVWLRGREVSVLVDLSKAPLYVLAPGPDGESGEAGAVSRIKWRSLSSLAEGTSMIVAGVLMLEDGRPVFVDEADEPLITVCHEGGEERLPSRLITAGRAPNEYWNYLTPISMAAGLVAISAMLLLFGASMFPTVRALVFLAGMSPVLPLAPPGLALFLLYRSLWRKALSARAGRDLLKLPLSYAAALGADAYVKRALASYEEAPPAAILIDAPDGVSDGPPSLTLFAPAGADDPLVEAFVVAGSPEDRARRSDRDASFYAAASGIVLGLAVLVNFALAFLIWRAAL
jgi:hypothetical protein